MFKTFEEFHSESEGEVFEIYRRIKKKRKKTRKKRSEQQTIAAKKKKIQNIGDKTKQQSEILKLKIRKLELRKKNASDTQKDSIQSQIDRLKNQQIKLEILVKKDLVAKRDDALKNNSVSNKRVGKFFKKSAKKELKDLKRKKKEI